MYDDLFVHVVFCRSYTVRSCVVDLTGGSHAPHSVEKKKRPTKKFFTLYTLMMNARDFDHDYVVRLYSRVTVVL